MLTPEDLGQAVRRLRRARHLSIEDLAFAARMHPTYLSGIERGVRNPSWAKLCGLADALAIPLPRIMQAVEEEAQVAQAVREARARLAHERQRP
jgi:transcriptional regulator with XRE-family HTH domain